MVELPGATHRRRRRRGPRDGSRPLETGLTQAIRSNLNQSKCEKESHASVLSVTQGEGAIFLGRTIPFMRCSSRD